MVTCGIDEILDPFCRTSEELSAAHFVQKLQSLRIRLGSPGHVS
jgi:hypothetical protein